MNRCLNHFSEWDDPVALGGKRIVEPNEQKIWWGEGLGIVRDVTRETKGTTGLN